MQHRMRIENVQIQEYRDLEPGYVLPGETPEQYKLIWLREGKLHNVSNGQDILLLPGELLLYPPGQWHMQYADADQPPHFIRILLTPAGMELSPITARRLSCGNDISFFLSQALHEAGAGDPFARSLTLSALEMALLRLLRDSGAVAAEQSIVPPRSENRIIHSAQQYVHAHVRDKLSVPSVAKNIDVSPSYLTALFQKHLHISPGEYIRRIKLQESKRLIREGGLTFTEIAAALNYSTVHHFSRQFKDKFGISPTDYAKSMRG